MRINTFFLLMTLVQFNCPIQTGIGLEKIFVDLNLGSDIYEHFNKVEQDPKFDLEFTREDFLASAEFRAKYIKNTEVYPDADSLEISVLTCNDINAFLKHSESNCVEVIVIYYPNSSRSIDEEYDRLNQLIKDAILLTDSRWKNHPGATNGAYFLTEKLSPFISIDKHTYRKNYITVSHYLEIK